MNGTGRWDINQQKNGKWTVSRSDFIQDTTVNCGEVDLSTRTTVQNFNQWFADHAQHGDWMVYNGEPTFVCLAPLRTKN